MAPERAKMHSHGTTMWGEPTKQAADRAAIRGTWMSDADLTVGARRVARGERGVALWVPLATLGLMAAGMGIRRSVQQQREARKAWQPPPPAKEVPGGLKSVLLAVFHKISADRVLANAAG